jgi:hypothetical protein
LAVAFFALSAPAEANNRTNFVDAAAIPAYPTSNYVRTARGRHHAARQARTHRVAAHRRHHEARQAREAPRRSPVRYSRPAHRQVAYGGKGVVGSRSARGETFLSHPSGCPRIAFCACGAAVEIFGVAKRSLWLAEAWFKFPRSYPAPGNVAVRRHHVFVLRERIEGLIWRVADYNSGGHQSRLHQRSIAGWTIVNPHGARYASR